MEYLPLGFFILGFLLILTEIFIPGFGVFGIVGTICVLIGIYLIEDNLYMALIEMAVVIIVMAILMPLLIKMMGRSERVQKLGLAQSLTTEEGFTSRKAGLEQYIGMTGTALTNLRPAGVMVMADDKRLDVVTRGDYIDKGAEVEVVAIDGTWLVVRQLNG